MKISAGSCSGAINEKGELFIWGKGYFGEFLAPTLFSNSGKKIVDFKINNGFGLAIDCENRIYFWGDNLEEKKELYHLKKLAGKNINKFSHGTVEFCIGIGNFSQIPGRKYINEKV